MMGEYLPAKFDPRYLIYGMGRYDLIWTIRSGKLISVVEEVCPNLEDSPEESGSYIDGGSPLMVQV